MSWQAPTDDGGATLIDYTVTAQGGTLQTNSDESTTWTPSGTPATVTTTATTASVSALDPSTTYEVTVTARNSAGSGTAAGPSSPVQPDLVYAAGTVQLTQATLDALSSYTGGTLTWVLPANSPVRAQVSSLTAGTDFLDNASANKVLTALNNASTTLRSEASSLGSNLSIVQIRQDFNKNLINVLQTGSSNLTLADTNEEAANSQALSTRQSIAVSALALANQSQASVLQLLR